MSRCVLLVPDELKLHAMPQAWAFAGVPTGAVHSHNQHPAMPASVSVLVYMVLSAMAGIIGATPLPIAVRAKPQLQTSFDTANMDLVNQSKSDANEVAGLVGTLFWKMLCSHASL